MVGWTGQTDTGSGQTDMGSVTPERQHGSQLPRDGAQEDPR